MSSAPLILEAGRAERHYWRDLWRYRELLFFLAWRDVAVHYKQTAIGIAWALVRPLSIAVVFVFVFHKLAQLSSAELPYPVLVLAGMLPWQLFAASLAGTSDSMVGNANLISKVYFPRLIVPLATLAVCLIDFLVTLPVLLVLMACYGVPFTWRLLALPLLVGATLLAALGPGLCLCALNVRFRDVRYVVPFVIQFGVYLSPVGFNSNLIPPEYQTLYALNPMVGVIDGFRWSVSGGATPFAPLAFALSLATSALFLTLGVIYFRKMERTFADVI
ncbi:phosphate ABC transporter permease [Planctomycetaceae bacterium SCGC AG-212-F19]|nr:phosphate ABC transporter permease [Planctomycetaceae bacterium SCGC AG-212-F19]